MNAEVMFSVVLSLLSVGLAGYTITVRESFPAIVAFVAYGLLLSLAWMGLFAPDVALTEAALGVAREADWRAGPVAVVGAELAWHAELEDARGRTRRIGFRVDRADFDGFALRLTDYKTGRTPNTAAREDKRAEHFLADVQRGTSLQAVAYAQGARALEAHAEGRLLFLHADLDASLRERIARVDDAALADAFTASARAALAAYDAGAHVPRLLEVESGAEPDACAWCEVRAACLRALHIRRRGDTIGSGQARRPMPDASPEQGKCHAETSAASVSAARHSPAWTLERRAVQQRSVCYHTLVVCSHY